MPFAGALLFALYRCLTRLVARTDSAETSLFYTGVAGAVAMTLVGPFFWTPIHGGWDWFWMLTLCVFGVLGHFLMIKAYEVAEGGYGSSPSPTSSWSGSASWASRSSASALTVGPSPARR